MNGLNASGTALAILCQALLKLAIRFIIQSSVLLAIGLVAGRAQRRSGPARQLHRYNATVGAVACCGLISIATAGRLPFTC